MIEQYFLRNYKKDLESLFSTLENKFSINSVYYDALTKDFPISNNGYIDFSLKFPDQIRFFFIYYDVIEQTYINNNIYNIINTVARSSYDNIKQLLDLFNGEDYYLTYGGNITKPFLKIYIVNNNICKKIDALAKLFNFEPRYDLDINMLGVNIIRDKIDLKLYTILNNPSYQQLTYYYPVVELLPEYTFKELSNIEVFISLLPQYDYRASIAFPTLYNKSIQERMNAIDDTRGIFVDNIYPSWIDFDYKGKLEIIYFRPKREYIYKDKDGNEKIFKDNDYNDYKKIGDITCLV